MSERPVLMRETDAPNTIAKIKPAWLIDRSNIKSVIQRPASNLFPIFDPYGLVR